MSSLAGQADTLPNAHFVQDSGEPVARPCARRHDNLKLQPDEAKSSCSHLSPFYGRQARAITMQRPEPFGRIRSRAVSWSDRTGAFSATIAEKSEGRRGLTSPRACSEPELSTAGSSDDEIGIVDADGGRGVVGDGELDPHRFGANREKLALAEVFEGP